MLKKIHIVGIYGTGKSTLAKKISQKLHIKAYDLDEIKYQRKYDLIRPVKERLKRVASIAQKKSWITEGTWTSYALPLYQKADLIIFLKIPEFKLYARIFLRHFKRKYDGEEYNNHSLMSTLRIMRQVWRYYHNPNNFMTLQSHQEYISKYPKQVIILRNKKEIERLVKSLEI